MPEREREKEISFFLKLSNHCTTANIQQNPACFFVSSGGSATNFCQGGGEVYNNVRSAALCNKTRRDTPIKQLCFFVFVFFFTTAVVFLSIITAALYEHFSNTNTHW